MCRPELYFNRAVSHEMSGRTLRKTDVDGVLSRSREASLPLIEGRLGDPTRYPGFESPNKRYQLLKFAGMFLGFIREYAGEEKISYAAEYVKAIAGLRRRRGMFTKLMNIGLNSKNFNDPEKRSIGNALEFSKKLMRLDRIAELLDFVEEAADIASEDYIIKNYKRMWSYQSASGLAELREILGLGGADVHGEYKLPADQVFIGAGISGILSNIFEIALGEGSLNLGKGGNVVTTDWCYILYSAEAARMGAEIKAVNIRSDGQVTQKHLKEVIDKNTKVVVFATVGNPIGIGMDPEEFGKIIEIVNKKEQELGRPIFLVADTIYEGYRKDRKKRLDPIVLSIKHGRTGPTIDLHGFSKMIGAPGDRFGFARVYWPKGEFKNYRKAFFNEMEILMQRRLGEVATSVQIAAYLFFRELNTSEERVKAYLRYKEQRRNEAFRRTSELARKLNEIGPEIVFPSAYKTGGIIDPNNFANSFYVVFGIDQGLMPNIDQSQAKAIAEFSLITRKTPVPALTPGENFRLIDENQRYSRVVSLLDDEQQDQLVDVVGEFVKSRRTKAQ